MSGNSPADRDDAVGEPFDQTNDQVQGLEGDSDGTAESDTASAAERDVELPGPDDARS